jgi:hypothetical protein
MNIGDYFNHMRAGAPQMQQPQQQQQQQGYPSQGIDRVAQPAIPVQQEQGQQQQMYYRQQPPGSLGALLAQYRTTGRF